VTTHQRGATPVVELSVSRVVFFDIFTFEMWLRYRRVLRRPALPFAGRSPLPNLVATSAPALHSITGTLLS
jgi:hypothetical protein